MALRLSAHMTVMQNAVQRASKRLLRDFAEVEQLQVSVKGPGDFVTQADIRASLEAAGRRATAASPLAWLRFEPSEPDRRPDLRLTLWPGAPDMRLAVADPHGRNVVWSGA